MFTTPILTLTLALHTLLLLLLTPPALSASCTSSPPIQFEPPTLPCPFTPTLDRRAARRACAPFTDSCRVRRIFPAPRIFACVPRGRFSLNLFDPPPSQTTLDNGNCVATFSSVFCNSVQYDCSCGGRSVAQICFDVPSGVNYQCWQACHQDDFNSAVGVTCQFPSSASGFRLSAAVVNFPCSIFCRGADPICDALPI